jgi:lipid kinase YegS
MRSARLILNGKSARQRSVRKAVFACRDSGSEFDVRITKEKGDAERLAGQAAEDGVERVIAGGGDGTVNEVVNGLMGFRRERRPALGIMPLGSANDLATSLGLPLDGAAALRDALQLPARRIDVPCLDGRYFLNMATGGIGAEITSATPKLLKGVLGGSAYSVIGAFKAWRYRLYPGRLRWEGGEHRVALFMLALGNGIQSGGGQRLTPKALLDDGLLDVLVVRDISSWRQLRRGLDELETRPSRGEFVDAFRTSWLSFEGEDELPLSLDGEPHRCRQFHVTIEPGGIELAVPLACPLLKALTGSS